MSTPKDPATGSVPQMSHPEILKALSGLLMGMFVTLLSGTVVSAALPRIISDLGGGQSAYTWVVTSTLLATTVSTPIWGKLADLMNRKLLTQISLVLFVAGSALAGLAQSTGALIAFRAVQGLGAGGMTALGVVLVADIISPRERGRYMGYMGGVMAVATVSGPLLGGVITDTSWLGWRWCFYVGAPFAAAAIVILQKTLHLPPRPHRVVRIDYWGALLLTAGASSLLIWVTLAGDRFGWLSWPSAAMLLGGVAALLLARTVELRTAEPIIPPHLMRDRTVFLAIAASVAVGLAMFGSSVFLSQYMQVARGYSPTMSGLLTVPMMIGVLGAATIVGRIITKTGQYKKWMVIGALLLPTGLALMGTTHYNTMLELVSVYMFILGVGVGMLMQNLVLAVQNVVAARDLGAASSTVAFFRSMGGAIGVSVLGAVIGHRVAAELPAKLAAVGVPPAQAADTTIPDVRTLPEPVRVAVESVYGDAIALVFLISAPISLVALVAVLLLREVPLRTLTGVQQLAEEGEPAAVQRLRAAADAVVAVDPDAHDRWGPPTAGAGAPTGGPERPTREG